MVKANAMLIKSSIYPHTLKPYIKLLKLFSSRISSFGERDASRLFIRPGMNDLNITNNLTAEVTIMNKINMTNGVGPYLLTALNFLR